MRSHQDPALLKAFAAEMKGRRAMLELSQDELALASGVTRTFVAKLELANTSPSLTTLFKLAEGLELDPAELLHAVTIRYKKELRANR